MKASSSRGGRRGAARRRRRRAPAMFPCVFPFSFFLSFSFSPARARNPSLAGSGGNPVPPPRDMFRNVDVAHGYPRNVVVGFAVSRILRETRKRKTQSTTRSISGSSARTCLSSLNIRHRENDVGTGRQMKRKMRERAKATE